MNSCLQCGSMLRYEVSDYSLNKYGVPLCVPHQRWLDQLETHSTYETIRLYFALKEQGVPAEIEKSDGYKHIDIVIEEAKIHIEVDGVHHNYDNRQALSDLKRTFFSFLDGYYTLRIPNSILQNDYDLELTTNLIVDILVESRRRNNNSRRYF